MLTRLLTHLRRRMRSWLLADDHLPEWPIRCESRGCRDAAAPYMLPNGRVVTVCTDCAQYLESLQYAAKRAPA